jgi:D-3-phosphoglycerate dehydrogenase
MISQITSALSEVGVNIENMMNKSKGDNAYTMADVSGDVSDAVVAKLSAIEGILRVRVIG